MSQARHSPLHVLHVVPTLGVGGMELTLSRLVRAAGAEFRHSIVVLKGDPAIGGLFAPEVDIIPMRARANEPLLALRLLRVIRRLKPAVIHARNWSAWPDVAVARLMAGGAAPLIFSFHGFTSAGPVPLRRRLASRLLAGVTSKIFTVSGAARRLMARAMSLPARRIDVIPNGVDTDLFSPAPRRRRRSKRIVIGNLASLTPVKNQAMLIRACAKLASGPMDFELRIAGEGPQREPLAELARSLGCTDRVELLGRIDQVAEFLRSLDVFVLCSATEAHPNALLEAMACGVACVGTRVGGVPWVLDDGRAGLLVDADDADALAGALTDLAADAKLRRRLAVAGRERAVSHFGLADMIARYVELYGRTAGVAPPRAAGRRGGPTHRPRVVMLGPLPPLTGGMATVVDNLRASSLAERCRLTVINNGKTTRPRRPLAAGIAAQLRLLGQLVGSILCGQAEVMHIHTCSGFPFWRDCLHALLGRLLGSRVVLHVHSGEFGQFAAALSPPRRSAMRSALQRAAAVVVLSDDWLRRLRPLAPRACWQVVPNGVPMPARFARGRGAEPTMLFLGDLGQRKRASDLVEAAAIAAGRGFGGRVIVAGGETRPGQKRALEELIAEAGCRSQVELVGLLAGGEKVRALESADCLVLPSYAEGLPMAILEAMSYGLAIVATEVGAIPEVVTDGLEGFLVAPGDVQALADRIVRLGADGELRRRMGLAARKKAAEFSLDRMAENLMQVYRQAAGGRGR